MKRILIVAAASLLAGCATWGQFDDGLRDLKGKPIGYAIDKLGYPKTEQVIAGRKLYRWGGMRSGVAYVPTTTTTAGSIGTGLSRVPVQTTTYGGTYVPTEDGCFITLEVDEKEIVRKWAYEGNLSGCEPYINALKKK